jgi:hypothetical protein
VSSVSRRAPVAEPGAGRRLVLASWIGTAVFTLTAAVAAVAPHTLDAPALVVSLALFFLGLGVFFWAFALAVARSRTDEIDLPGLFGLAGSAPRRVQVQLFGSLAVEAGVALATAGVRPYTTLAFGILTPMFGLAMTGLWAARYGTFPARVVQRPKRRRGGR